MNAVVLGAGAWGTTIANLLAKKGNLVTIWSYEKGTADDINFSKENKKFLPGIKLNEKITAASNFLESINNKDLIVLAIPTQFIRSVLTKEKFNISPETVCLSISKGIEKETLKTPSQIVNDFIQNEIVALSGPNLSKEIANDLPAASVAASKDMSKAKIIQEILSGENFRVYTSRDVIGVELGGALKNVIAIAAGICDGLNLGNNAKSALMVRGMSEISRLGIKLGAEADTFMGLSGIGDLITTCSSSFSRNHFVGEEIAKGNKLANVLSKMNAVPEGVDTVISALELSKKHKIEMPIAAEVYRVLFESKNPKESIFPLMTRDLKTEIL